MLKKVKRFLNRFLATLNVLAIIAMCISGYSGLVSPVDHPLIAISGLAFPVLLAINLAFLVFWIFFYWRMVLLPVAGLLACYQPIRQFCPMNREKEITGDCIKVMSYNVHLYGCFDPERTFKTGIVDYIKESGADIVCIQESTLYKRKGVSALTCYDDVYPYKAHMSKVNGSTHFIYSKYPILSKDTIPIISRGNMSEVYELDIDGDTVLVINNHLETYGLSLEEKKNYEDFVEGKNDNYSEKNLLKKIIKATQIRARQAEAVAAFIKKHRDMPIILCGDFNDTPLSYVHRTIREGLTDTYVTCGNGPGFSYANNRMYERIDNIFCSEHFEPVQSMVDSKIKLSDHRPIISVLKKRPNH